MGALCVTDAVMGGRLPGARGAASPHHVPWGHPKICQPGLGQMSLFRASPSVPVAPKGTWGGINTLQNPLGIYSISVSIPGLAMGVAKMLSAGFSLTAWAAERLHPAPRPSRPCACWLKSWEIWQSIPPRSAPGQHRLFQPIKLISIQPWWVPGCFCFYKNAFSK